jgi:hypothetical protein
LHFQQSVQGRLHSQDYRQRIHRLRQKCRLEDGLNGHRVNLINLDRYSIDDLDQGEGAVFLEQCQQHIEQDGWCSFEGFLHPDAVVALTEAKTLLPTAEKLTIKRTIYNGVADSSVPENDSRSQEYVHSTIQLPDDQIPTETMIKPLYQSNY